jgi:acyl-CoA thioester hydrolase
MKHENLVKIYHKDTDCYGVVWHGAYIQWFEMGRVELSNLAGIDFNYLDKHEILMPVVELNCRYKHPGKLFDRLSITTELKELKQTSISFSHTIQNIDTESLILTAVTTVVTTNKKGKMHRKMPDYLFEKYKNLLPIPCIK